MWDRIERELTPCELATTASFSTPPTSCTRSYTQKSDTFQVGYNYETIMHYRLLFQLRQPLLRYHTDRELTQCKLATTASFPTPTTASTRSQRERIDTFQVGYNYEIIKYYSLFTNPNNLLYEITKRENWTPCKLATTASFQTPTTSSTKSQTERIDTLQVGYNY